MAGIVFVVIDPSNYWTQYLCSEMIYPLSFMLKEDLLMVIKALGEHKSFAEYLIKANHWFWEVCLPYRRSLLKSW